MASKNKRNQAKFKWTKELTFLVVFLVAMIAITVVLAIPSSAKRNLNKYNEAITAYNTENSTSISTLTTDNVFEEISGGYDKQVSNVMDAVKKEQYTYVFYGKLTEGQFLTQLAEINTVAKEYEVKKVYIFLANYVSDAEANSETATSTYNNQIKEYNKILNADRFSDCKEFDMASTPALLVYKDGKLFFNTQSDADESFTWSQYINKAFGFEKNSK